MNAISTDTAEPIATDLLRGAAAIAAHTGDNERRTHYLLERNLLPAFKVGGIWHMRRSTYAAHVARLEAEAMAKMVAA